MRDLLVTILFSFLQRSLTQDLRLDSGNSGLNSGFPILIRASVLGDLPRGSDLEEVGGGGELNQLPGLGGRLASLPCHAHWSFLSGVESVLTS